MPHLAPDRRAVVHSFLLLLLFISSAAAHAAPPSAPSQAFDRWYVLQMDGQRLGWMHSTVTQEGEHLVSSTHVNLTVRRGLVELAVVQDMRFVETLQGKPVEAVSTVKLGTMPMTTTMRFDDDAIEVATQQMGGEQVQRFPAPEQNWLPPVAGQRYIEERIAAGDKQIKLHTIDPSAGPQPFEMTVNVVGEQVVEVLGKSVPAIARDVSMSNMPGMTVRDFVDHQGRSVKTTMQVMPGLEIVVLQADEQLARSPVDPPEMMASMLVEPNQPIEQPRELRSAVYEVTLKHGPLPDGVDIPRTGVQRVVWGDQTTARVVVDLDTPMNPGMDLPTEENLAASPTLNHSDEAIQKLLTEALGDDAAELADVEKAERLRQFVQQFIDEKDLSVGMATASEVARTAQGDCTEHAVLLAALLRAADIPSRTATGLVYVEEFLGRTGVFGGHMWTQAWLPSSPEAAADDSAGHRWVDLDATLDQHAFDAAHITLGTSAMSEQHVVNELVRVLPLMNSLDITVVTPAATH